MVCESDTSMANNAGRVVSRNKGAFSPYMRIRDSKCYFAHFRGKHKCYLAHDNFYRLCGCMDYAQIANEDYTPSEYVVPEQANGAGWHKLSGVNCNRWCKDARKCDGTNWSYPDRTTEEGEACWQSKAGMNLYCDVNALKSIKGVYRLTELTDMLGDTCTTMDDRLSKKKAPMKRDVDNRCWVNPVSSNVEPACNLVSRATDYRYCPCSNGGLDQYWTGTD